MEFWEGTPSAEVNMNRLDKSRVDVRPINSSVARDIVLKHHYSHTWPVAKLSMGLYVDSKLNAVIVYGLSASARMPGSLPSEKYWELQRLFSFDWAGKNTESFLISKSIKYIKNNHPEIECLVSFADPDQGHVGIVYQATNWLYCGISDPTGGYVYKFNGKWEHPRTTGERLKTRVHENIIKMYPDIEYRKAIRKHRYIYLLPKNKKHKKQLMANLLNKYEILPYPKN